MPPQQVQQKPAVAFNKVLQQLRQQQQSRAVVDTMPPPVPSLVSVGLMYVTKDSYTTFRKRITDW